MAAQPVIGSTLWGAAQNAFTGTSLDPATGKIKNEALQVASTAPIADAALANKKYVDDTGAMAPLIYTGGEAVNFPNGLTLRHGETIVTSGAVSTIVYGTALSNGVVSANATYKGADASITSPAGIRPQPGNETTTIQVTNGDSSTQTIYWQVWGY